jgi:hypothetical protein
LVVSSHDLRPLIVSAGHIAKSFKKRGQAAHSRATKRKEAPPLAEPLAQDEWTLAAEEQP